MKNFFQVLLVVVGCFGDLYCNADVFSGPVVEGSLTFSFYPTGTGVGGTWTPVILTPDGEYISGAPVSYDSTDQVDLNITCCQGAFVELGPYVIELKNNLTGSVDDEFLNKVVVKPTIPTVPFDVITYKTIPPSSEGEKVVLFYFLPSMEDA
jgi:hypothetical protein